MNSTDQVPSSETEVQVPPPEPQSVQDPAPCLASRGNGFVARLPKAIRDQLNQMMLDAVPYAVIIERLGEPARHLKPSYLTEWKKRGHQDWLLHQDWLAERRIRQESAGDLLDDCDATRVNQGALQLGTLYIYDALRDLRAGGIESKLGGDSAAFARLLNALSRASRETLQLQKYRDVCDRARAALNELKDPKRKLNESETRAIVHKVDYILGLRSDDPDDPAPPAASPSSPARIKREMAGSCSSPALRDEEAPSEHGETPSDCRRRGNETLINRGPAMTEAPSAAKPSTSNLQSATSAPPLPQSKFKIQNSKISESPQPVLAQPVPATPVFPLACGFCPDGPTRLGANFKHCCKDSASESSPPAPSSTLAPCASTPEECYYCRQELPPLLPNGQRPFTHFEKCGTALRPPETRHLYCPRCHGRLHNIFDGDHRTSDHCPHCADVLPPLATISDPDQNSKIEIQKSDESRSPLTKSLTPQLINSPQALATHAHVERKVCAGGMVC